MRYLCTLFLFFQLCSLGCINGFGSKKTPLPMLFEAAEFVQEPMFAYQGQVCTLAKANGSEKTHALTLASKKANQRLLQLLEKNAKTVPEIDRYNRHSSHRNRGIQTVTMPAVSGHRFTSEAPVTNTTHWVSSGEKTGVITAIAIVCIASHIKEQ